MAQYRILNPVIKTIEPGKQNAGKKYLVASLQNARCIWETPQRFTSFNENVVNAFTQILSIQKGGTQQQDQPIPEELQTLMGCWADYTPEQKFYKQHLSNHPAVPPSPTNPQGRPEIRAGELIKKGGIPVVYTTLRVFCQYYIDEFNEKQFLKGESPLEVGQRAFNAYCIPINEDKTPQITEDPIVQVSAQPSPQQPVQQPTFTQQPGAGPLPY